VSERAYSLELNRNISAKQASNFSIKGRLHDRRAFQCSNPNCQINMTCTNWNKKGIRYFFTPSSQDELHVIGCSELSEEEIKEQEKLKSNLDKETNQTTNSNNKMKSEARHVYPIASFINLFEDPELDKDSQIIAIENEKISLNELFLESKNNFVPYDCTRIIYGEALIRTAKFGN